MEVMGPKLHTLVEQIVSRQTFDKSEEQVCLLRHIGRLSGFDVTTPCWDWRDQVKPMIGTRLGTSAPSDMFALMSENMSIVKSKSSPSLQVRSLGCFECWFRNHVHTRAVSATIFKTARCCWSHWLAFLWGMLFTCWLQRRVLCAVMVEVVFYCGEILTDMMTTWDTNKAFLTLDYVRTSDSPSRCPQLFQTVL